MDRNGSLKESNEMNSDNEDFVVFYNYTKHAEEVHMYCACTCTWMSKLHVACACICSCASMCMYMFMCMHVSHVAMARMRTAKKKTGTKSTDGNVF